jgi:hypothetical protein
MNVVLKEWLNVINSNGPFSGGNVVLVTNAPVIGNGEGAK